MRELSILIPPHAEWRMCQRAFPLWLVHLLLECGKTEHSKGDIICHLHDKRAWQKAVRALSEDGVKADNHLRDAYIVVTDDWQKVITAGWRYRPVKRGLRSKRRQKRNKGMRR